MKIWVRAVWDGLVMFIEEQINELLKKCEMIQVKEITKSMILDKI